MKNNRMSFSAKLEFMVLEAFFPAFRRLQLIQNGVMNYGGGIFSLRRRIIESRAQVHDPELASLLLTVEGYLNGLIEVSGNREGGEKFSDGTACNAVHMKDNQRKKKQ